MATERILISPEGNPEVWRNKEFAREITGLEYMTEEEWAICNETLEEKRSRALRLLKERRLEQEYSGFILNDQHWDSGIKDELRLNSAKSLFDSGVTEIPGWKISAETYVTLTPELLRMASAALMEHCAQAFATEQAKQAEIMAFETAGELQLWIDYTLGAGW